MDLNFPAVKNVSPDPIPFQLRLDFSSMTLAQPESTDNKCSDDQFIGKSELGQKNKQTNKQNKQQTNNKCSGDQFIGESGSVSQGFSGKKSVNR